MSTIVVVGGYLSIDVRLAWLLDLGIVFWVSSRFLAFSAIVECVSLIVLASIIVDCVLFQCDNSTQSI